MAELDSEPEQQPTRFLINCEVIEPGASCTKILRSGQPPLYFKVDKQIGGDVVKVELCRSECRVTHFESAYKEVGAYIADPRSFRSRPLEIAGLHIEAKVDPDNQDNVLITLTNNSQQRLLVARDAIVAKARKHTGGIFPYITDLINGGKCELELDGKTPVVIATAYGRELGLITRERDSLVLRSYSKAPPIVLGEVKTALGRSFQDLEFFTPEARPFVSRDHATIEVRSVGPEKWKMRVSDQRSTNGTEVWVASAKTDNRSFEKTPHAVQLRALREVSFKHVTGLRLLRNTTDITERIENDPVLRAPDFSKFALCGNVDGELNFDNARLYGCTLIGGRSEERNEDGVYANPVARIIAGDDGISLGPAGHIASLGALFSAHFDTTCSHVHIKEMATRASVVLQKVLALLGIRYNENTLPGTMFGYACERRAGDRCVIEGYHIGDYKVVVIDLNDKKLLYDSMAQTYLAKLIAKGYRGSAHETTLVERIVAAPSGCIFPYPHRAVDDPSPTLFSVEVPRGHTIVTVVCSDGITDKVGVREMMDFLLMYGDEGGRLIVEAALEAETSDNVSYAHMFTTG